MKTMRRLLSRVGIINTGSGFFGLRVPYGWLYVSRRKMRQGRNRKPMTPEELNEHNRRTQTMRALLWEKQRGGCKVCGVKLAPEQMQIHHIRPKALHPELAWEPGNMQGVCARCHQLLHSVAATPEAVRAELLWMARRDAGRTE